MSLNKLATAAAAAYALRPAAAQSIYDSVKASPILTALAGLIDSSEVGPAGPNLVDALSGPGAFTLFAPTDDALQAFLPPDVISKLLEPTWQPQLQDLLLYHALGSEVRSTDLVDGTSVEALNGEEIAVNLDPPRLNGESNILVADGLVDFENDNGVLHGIDAPLAPASLTQTIFDQGALNPDLSTLVSAATAAGLVDALSADGPLTLFAPSNAAFDALPDGALDALLQPDNVEELADILLYHVVEGNAHSAGLSSGPVRTRSGESVDVVVSDGGVAVNGVDVTGPDVIASNGIIHVIDAVLLRPDDGTVPPTKKPTVPNSIFDIAKRNGDDFGTLVVALEAADYDDLLSGPGTFTIFAPTNAAFAELPQDLVAKLLDPTWQPQLRDLLQYHALGSVVRSTDLSDDLTVATLNGENITVNLDPPRINNSSNILVDDFLDIDADNGIIHGVDSVLTPASVTSNIVDLAAGNDDFSTLVAALAAAGLDDALAGEGPFTVFAPTDAAFARLPGGTLDSLLEPGNVGQLADILMYHVVAANIPSSAITTGDVDTLNGAPVDVVVSGGGVTVDNASVVIPDVIASNGIIHAIDAVLLPPTDGDTTTVPTKMSSATSKSRKRPKVSKGGKQGKGGKSSKGMKSSKGTKTSKGTTSSKGTKSSKSTKATKGSKGSKGAKSSKSTKATKGSKGSKGPKSSRWGWGGWSSGASSTRSKRGRTRGIWKNVRITNLFD